MHIFFSGIGGAGIGPLAMVAQQAGYTVSGSDKQDSQYISYLKKHGITNIHIGQDAQSLANVHSATPIDWFVYSSAVEKENANAPELVFVREQSIKFSKRDELLNQILTDKQQKLIAIAGTHGKTTTTAMAVWLLTQLKTPISYILPAKTSFADMGHFNPNGEFFVYECDEFDRNFLAYQPYLSLITGVSWDHHEIFPTREDYQAAFKEFISQSAHTILWREDYDYLSITGTSRLDVLESDHPHIQDITLAGQFTRLDAWLVIQAIHEATKTPVKELIAHMNKFPGLQRRMEQLVPNLYSDYAHTPEKIRGGMSVALEMASAKNQDVVIVYEGLTNRRQHYMINDYKDCFDGAKQVIWIPSYLAREDPNQRIVPPAELIQHLADPSIATAMERNEALKKTIQAHLNAGDMVVGMAGGGGDSLDEWLRREFTTLH
jgi:UDP-N-acetylmuramate--alanine ligase